MKNGSLATQRWVLISRSIRSAATATALLSRPPAPELSSAELRIVVDLVQPQHAADIVDRQQHGDRRARSYLERRRMPPCDAGLGAAQRLDHSGSAAIC